MAQSAKHVPCNDENLNSIPRIRGESQEEWIKAHICHPSVRKVEEEERTASLAYMGNSSLVRGQVKRRKAES